MIFMVNPPKSRKPGKKKRKKKRTNRKIEKIPEIVVIRKIPKKGPHKLRIVT